MAIVDDYHCLSRVGAETNLVQSSMYPRENEELTLTCITSHGAEIVLWKRNDIDVTYMLQNGSKCLTLDGGSGLTVNYKYSCTDNRTYNLIIPTNRIRQENGSKWQCYNADGSSNSKTITLKMASAPTSDPVVTGYNGTILYSGHNTKLTCAVQGGTPLATLSWTCEGSNITDIKNGTTTAALSEITLSINNSYNGKRCVCTAEHLLWDTKKKGENIPSVEPTLTGYTNGTVLYEGDLTVNCQQTGGYPLSVITWSCEDPPSSPTLQTSGTSFPWVENTRGVLKCSTFPGNPPETTYDWLQNSLVINGHTGDIYTIPTLTNVHNGLRIQCRVSNLYTNTPVITLDTTDIIVQEGDNLSRQCSATGNPTPTVKWYRGSSENTSGTGTSATLALSNIGRNQADTYQCKATATGKLNFESSKDFDEIEFVPEKEILESESESETDDLTVIEKDVADVIDFSESDENEALAETPKNLSKKKLHVAVKKNFAKAVQTRHTWSKNEKIALECQFQKNINLEKVPCKLEMPSKTNHVWQDLHRST
ncbi:hypothetical protein KUTeg_014709 [Tegillarca granosa]|uniref:Ig-like domain-containing protein n=1 Tax=Tegillarca granosa TaxID=220873 RepID=A0ABQ9EWV4_TEGGR|nr:hypothetical protein KUTeg_014709 [Tegillarca granosa]